ncbi:PucR family transcriptional regulator [Enterococcus faecalis]|uniref:PucR family transcriptional regulator n=1 Tax=Enterococcus faecalis TaxID=1351 RepID=UPI001558A753|nr:PucR family transcriptional regulator [Enterococcus faecalis]
MKLRELLSIGDLKKGKILTKEIGLDNEVDSAMVLEAIDIENWSRKNQLILTSFYALHDLPEKELENFFVKMRRIGISGLILKTDRFIKMIPEWFIELCFNYEIPLIKITQDISYEKILFTIYEPLLNYQSHVLRTYYDVRQRFTKLERHYPTVETIMQEFYDIIKLPFALKMLDKHLEISDGDLPHDAIDVLQEKFNTENLLKKERYTRLNNLADAILQNTPQNPDELNSLLREVQMQELDSYQAIAFSTKDTNTQLMKERIIALLRTLRVKSIFFDQLNYSAVLFNFNESDGKITKLQLSRLLAELLEENDTLTVAVSSLKSREGIKELLIECLDILRFNETFYNGPIVTLADIGVFKNFIREDQLENLDELIPRALYQLAENNYDLFETLYSFFQNNRNYKQTSEAMFLHSKTIRYRLNKVEQLLDIDLANPLQLLNYEIATYIIKMRRRALEKQSNTR